MFLYPFYLFVSAHTFFVILFYYFDQTRELVVTRTIHVEDSLTYYIMHNVIIIWNYYYYYYYHELKILNIAFKTIQIEIKHKQENLTTTALKQVYWCILSYFLIMNIVPPKDFMHIFYFMPILCIKSIVNRALLAKTHAVTDNMHLLNMFEYPTICLFTVVVSK